jgi:hypothetical protein
MRSDRTFVKFNRFYVSTLLVLSAAAITHPLLAQTGADVAELVKPAPATDSMSSSTTPEVVAPALVLASASEETVSASRKGSKAFSAVGVDVKIGTGGIGFDIATPLARKFNLRGTGSFFKYNASITENLVTYGGNIQLASGAASLDWFPFGGAFRLSGGIVGYNGNQLTGSATLNPNQSFTLNGTTYYTSATDPLHATGTLHLGAKVAPSFSFGWGNIVPRKVNKHFSVPVEIGFVYVGYPTVELGFVGSTCDAHGTVCHDVASNPTFQQDLSAQKEKYRDQINALRFYPTVSVGFGYKF